MVGMMMVALMVVALAVTGDLCLKNKTLGFAKVMMVMRHNGVKHDNCTCQRNHYFSNQMPHITNFTSETNPQVNPSPTLQRYK